jgi:hypothetical protein
MSAPSLAPAIVLLLASIALADEPAPPDTAALVTQNSHVFTFGPTTLEGAGADLLRKQVAQSQFVLLGETHMDHLIPIFAGALFRMLHDTHGFRHLVVEQDPVAIEDVGASAVRGDVDEIAALSKRYPTLFEFDSDEDLTLLADVGKLENNTDAIWGVEQATGAVRYLEELVTLAPDASARSEAQALLEAARTADAEPKYNVHWLIADTTPGALAALGEAFDAQPGSRAARLIAGLAKSSEIFGYYRRAEAGEYVGLYNNTVREEVLKANFLERYHAAAKRGALPKAMFKFGSNHLYHGRNPVQAFPIGNLAHELAIVNGMQAYGLYVQPLGAGYVELKDLPEWMRPLLPASEPAAPTLIDLRALRPYQRLFREKVPPPDQWQLRDLINGYDALVLLPGSKPSSRKLGGRETP